VCVKLTRTWYDILQIDCFILDHKLVIAHCAIFDDEEMFVSEKHHAAPPSVRHHINARPRAGRHGGPHRVPFDRVGGLHRVEQAAAEKGHQAAAQVPEKALLRHSPRHINHRHRGPGHLSVRAQMEPTCAQSPTHGHLRPRASYALSLVRKGTSAALLGKAFRRRSCLPVVEPVLGGIRTQNVSVLRHRAVLHCSSGQLRFH